MSRSYISYDINDFRSVFESLINYLEEGYHVSCLPWDISKDREDLQKFKNTNQRGILFSLAIDNTDTSKRFIDFLKKELELIGDE